MSEPLLPPPAQDNSTPTPQPTPTRITAPASRRFSIKLNDDILLACEDQAQSQGLELESWVEQTCNDALAGYLGV